MKHSFLSHLAPFGIASCFLAISTLAMAREKAPSTAEKPMTEVHVRDLNKNPGKFAGQPVVVTGKVTRIEGPGAFIIEGSGFLNNKILAVVEGKQKAGTSGQPGTTPPKIKEKQKLQLTGKVVELGVTKIEANYTPLKAEIKEEFEGNIPVLVVPADGIKVLS